MTDSGSETILSFFQHSETRTIRCAQFMTCRSSLSADDTGRIGFSTEGEERLNLFPNTNALSQDPKAKTHKRICYALLIGGVSLVGLLLAGGFSAFVVWLLLSGGNVVMLDSVTKTLFSSNLIKHLVVHSYAEFKQLVDKDIHESYSLTLNLTTTQDWPAAHLVVAPKVVAISVIGSITSNIFVAFLSQVTRLTRLKITNIDGRLCKALSLDKTSQATEVILQIDTFLIQGISDDCTGDISKIMNLVTINTLQELSISDSMIDDRNVNPILNILENNKPFLRDITFDNVRSKTNRLQLDKFGSMDQVRSLKLDIINEPVQNDYFAEVDIGRHFPNLEKLSLGSRPRTLQSTVALAGIPYLADIEANISLASTSNFSVYFLIKKFPLLQKANIYLHYPECLHDVNRYILDLKLLSDNLLKHLRILSNCDMLGDVKG